jgi:hypothetical protein
MTATPSTPDAERAGLIVALREIIAALDRRGPQIGRAGETRIAEVALILRRQAEARLDELRRATDGGGDDDAFVAAASSDDDSA